VSGVLSALVSSGSALIYSVTVAETSSGIFGYNPPDGAISSTAVKSATINNVRSRTASAGSPDDIGIVLDGSLAQSFFSALIVQRTDGTVSQYSTANATFSVFGGGTLSQWTWDNNDPAWTAEGTRFLMLRV
jgi:hypothetical protein